MAEEWRTGNGATWIRTRGNDFSKYDDEVSPRQMHSKFQSSDKKRRNVRNIMVCTQDRYHEVDASPKGDGCPRAQFTVFQHPLAKCI